MPARPGSGVGSGATVDPEQASALHELALAAELSYVWSSQLTRALDAYAQAARTFLQEYQAGKNPDPVPLLVRFGAASELLDQIEDRFEIGAESLAALDFTLNRPTPPREVVKEAKENLILLHPEQRRSKRATSKS